MLYNHFTEELLGLQVVKITNVQQEENLIIHLEKKNRRNFPKPWRYFKNSKKLLLKRFNKSENEQQQQVLVMSETSVNLSRSHQHKKKFLEILDCNDRETAKEKMQEWIYNASNCGIPQFEKCADSMQNWLTGILNYFSSP